MLALLSRLIAMPTHNPGGDEVALARLLAEELRARGADQVILREVPRSGGRGLGARVLALFGPGPARLVINAHLDTVPPNRGWTGDPFVTRVVDDPAGGDRLIGLGAADTKGAIAAILSALAKTRPRNVAILFSGDEEVGASVMHEFLASEDRRALALERAIVCEPTGCRVGTRHRGILAMKLRREGPGGHSSRADHLPAPVAELCRVGAALERWGRERRESGPAGMRGMCLNVAALDGGIAFNVIPSAAELTVSVRPPPTVGLAELEGELRSVVAAALPEAAPSFPHGNPPHQTRAPEAFVPLLGERARQPIDLDFWTEAALFSQAGVDAVVWGPGEIAAAHAPDESVAVSQLVEAEETLTRLFSASAKGHA